MCMYDLVIMIILNTSICKFCSEHNSYKRFDVKRCFAENDSMLPMSAACKSKTKLWYHLTM